MSTNMKLSTTKDLENRIDKEIEARKKAGIENLSDMYGKEIMSDDEYDKAMQTMGRPNPKRGGKTKRGRKTKRKRTYKKKNNLRKKTRRH